MRFVAPAWLWVAVLLPSLALAHKPSDSYLGLDVDRAEVRVRWDISLRDLDYALGLDRDTDGAITWGEVRRQHGLIAGYALEHLDVARGGEPCALQDGGLRIDHHSDGAYAVLALDARCARSEGPLEIDYRLLFDLDPTHRGLLRAALPGGTRTAVFGPGRTHVALDPGRSAPWRQLREFAAEGVVHIFIGIDHLLFLVTLLLPAVLFRRGGAWHAAAGLRPVLGEVLRVVTAFTVAHSVTLTLAALGHVDLPSRWVESAIAASVVVAAANNLYPVITRRVWLVAFVLGLIHGLGFAAVLADLGLGDGALVRALLGFNLGVEAGQLAFVALVLPALFALRRWPRYPGVVVRSCSFVIAAVASVWLLERLQGG